MFGTMKRGVSAYANVGLETGVASASPHKLIVMLYDGALQAVINALANMKAGNIPAKGAAISKAITIIDNGLRASLDKNAGGELAEGLDALYHYMSTRLFLANLHNSPEMLEEVRRLLGDLREAWHAIGPQVDPAQAPAQAGAADHAPTLMSA